MATPGHRGGRGVGEVPSPNHNPCIPCTPLGVHGMQGRASLRDARGGRFPPPTTARTSHAPLKGCKGCKRCKRVPPSSPAPNSLNECPLLLEQSKSKDLLRLLSGTQNGMEYR
ncbi:hypothetical protein COCOBI_pt-2420 (chloroplast) [Coccomyxa sp. Obi]|nr:hypothetical protein COCOBI_pt-2420 [Coccomyxa sp. Obi]